MLNSILESGLKFAIVDGGLSVRGSVELVREFQNAIQQWKPEIVKIVADETVDDVGVCEHCHGSLIGLPTFDHYVNRVCPDCGRWRRCLDPYHDWTDSELTELLDERTAIIPKNEAGQLKVLKPS